MDITPSGPSPQASRWLDPVRAVLDAAPEPVTVFFRDDDAGWAGRRLLDLLDRFAELGLPLDLAVIPAALDARMATELRARAGGGAAAVGLHQHGYAHADHEREGRKCEFGPSRAGADQRRDIERGRERLRELLDGHVDPIFTPPWNRCTEVTGRCLAELGFRALSREARADPFGIDGLAELPVHLDWSAHRHGIRLTFDELALRLAGFLQGRAPVGIMLHHAIMRAPDFVRAGELLRLLAS